MRELARLFAGLEREVAPGARLLSERSLRSLAEPLRVSVVDVVLGEAPAWMVGMLAEKLKIGRR